MDSLEIRIRLIEELTKLQAPVVFKGCVVLNMLLSNSGLNTRRGTKDLDINWTSTNDSLNYVAGVINLALRRTDIGLSAEVFREFAVHQSAGFKVLQAGVEVCRLDVNLSSDAETCTHITPNGVESTCVSLNNILVDKLGGISTRTVFRRVKDVYDLYLLSHLKVFSVREVYELLTTRGRSFGLFMEFLCEEDKVEHAYSKFRGIDNKPSFDVLYDRVRTFIEPFTWHTRPDLVWNGYNWVPSML